MTKAVAKWTDGISNADLTELAGLADDINKNVETAVKSVVKAKIAIGKQLIAARKIIPGDAQFGQWRKENTTIGSKTEANYCMQIAEKFGNTTKLIKNTSWSALRELTAAPASLIKELEEKAESTGTGPSVTEAREAVREATGATPAATAGDGADRPPPPPPLTQKNGSFDINKLVAKDFDSRYKFIRQNPKQIKAMSTTDAEWAYLLFGLDPEPSRPMNPKTLTIIYYGYLEMAKDPEQGGTSERVNFVRKAQEALERDIANFYNG